MARCAIFLSEAGARLKAAKMMSSGGLLTSIKIDTACADRLLVYLMLAVDMNVSTGTMYS